MSMRDLLRSTARLVFDTAALAEEVTYYPGGVTSAARVIPALVNRRDRAPREENDAVSAYTFEVWVLNDAAKGITAVDVSADELLAVVVFGEPPMRCRVERVVESNEAAFRLQCVHV